MRDVLIAIFMSVLVTSTVQQHGRQIDDCIWEYENGRIVDLNGIGNVDGTAKWNNKTAMSPDEDPNLYTINPCHGFTMGTVCQDVTVCRITTLGIPVNIADVSSGRMYFSEDENNAVLEYSHTDSADPEMVYISRFIFACFGDPEAQVVVQGVENSSPVHVIHRFILLIPCAPPIATAKAAASSPPTVSLQPLRTATDAPPSVSLHPIRTATDAPPSVSLHPIITQPVTKATINPPPLPPKKNLTPGGVLCIIFVCCACGYFLIGSFYMFCCSGARGIEIIPNIHFWLDLPNLIMDGFFFIFSCGGKVPMVSSPGEDYDKI